MVSFVSSKTFKMMLPFTSVENLLSFVCAYNNARGALAPALRQIGYVVRFEPAGVKKLLDGWRRVPVATERSPRGFGKRACSESFRTEGDASRARALRSSTWAQSGLRSIPDRPSRVAIHMSRERELCQRFEIVGATSPSRFSIFSRGTPDRIEARSARPRVPSGTGTAPAPDGAPKPCSSPSPALCYNAQLPGAPQPWLVTFQQLPFERVETYPLGNENWHCGDDLSLASIRAGLTGRKNAS